MWWGSGCRASRNTASPQRRGARLLPRGTRECPGLYVLCRICWPDRCGRSLQSAPAPGDTLGRAHPFHYTVARASPAPAPALGNFARHSLPGAASARLATICWIAFSTNSPQIQPGTRGSLQNPSTTSRSTNNLPKPPGCCKQTHAWHCLMCQITHYRLLAIQTQPFFLPKANFSSATVICWLCAGRASDCSHSAGAVGMRSPPSLQPREKSKAGANG